MTDLLNRDALRDLVRELMREIADEQKPGDEWLSVKEAAVIAKVQPAAIRAWIAEKKLVAGRIGTRHFRIKRSDLDAALAPGAREKDRDLSPEDRARRDLAKLSR